MFFINNWEEVEINILLLMKIKSLALVIRKNNYISYHKKQISWGFQAGGLIWGHESVDYM